jgi:hypothetical protein
VVTFVGQAQQDLNQRRREGIKPDVNPEYRQLCSSQAPVTTLLFGDDLAKTVKDQNETNKMTGKFTSSVKDRSKFANKGKAFLGQRYQYTNRNPY